MADLTRANIIETAERRAYVLEQRKGGLTYREISARTIDKFGEDNLPKGYDERYAWMDVKAELIRLQDSNKEEAQEVKELELQRLDRMQSAIWGQVLKGNQGAIDRALRIMARRADLLGLDAPKKVAPTNPDGDKPYESVNDERFDRTISTLADALRESILGKSAESNGEMDTAE